MNDEQPRDLSMEERSQLNGGCKGMPKYFHYPKPLPMSDEERRLVGESYAEASRQIDELLANQKRRKRSRRR